MVPARHLAIPRVEVGRHDDDQVVVPRALEVVPRGPVVVPHVLVAVVPRDPVEVGRPDRVVDRPANAVVGGGVAVVARHCQFSGRLYPAAGGAADARSREGVEGLTVVGDLTGACAGPRRPLLEGHHSEEDLLLIGIENICSIYMQVTYLFSSKKL